MLNSNQNPIPANSVGIGLRHPHHQFVLDAKPKVSWFEVHSENFFSKGGAALNFIKKIRQDYPLSLHCVGLSLGSTEKVSKKHLQSLKNLISITDPFLVSDHISWSAIDNKVLNDLLPIPYTKESLKVLCDNISQTQDFLKRQILVENPSTYLSFVNSQIPEDEFINQVAKISGCKILLDINNIYVSSKNNNFDAKKYLKNINPKIVGEMHLAGHSVRTFPKSRCDELDMLDLREPDHSLLDINENRKHSKSNIDNHRSRDLGQVLRKVGKEKLLVDTHNDFVCDAVWDLYKIAAQKFKNAPTLIEWDQDIPEFKVLMNEAKKAQRIINKI